MKIKNVLFTIIAGSCLFSCQLQSGNRGINYYVDAQNGSDVNSGMSVQQAW